MKRIFSHANKSDFLNKGFIFSLVLKVKIFWKSEMAYFYQLMGCPQTRGPGWGLSFFEECYFRIRVRVSVNPNNILLKKIDPGPRACVYTDTPTYACRVTKLTFFEEN